MEYCDRNEHANMSVRRKWGQHECFKDTNDCIINERIDHIRKLEERHHRFEQRCHFCPQNSMQYATLKFIPLYFFLNPRERDFCKHLSF